MAKNKFTAVQKLAMVHAYLSGKGSYESLAKEYGIDKGDLRLYVRKYQLHGEEAFSAKPGYAKYTSDFKKECIEKVLLGEGSIRQVTAEYNISSRSVLCRWISCYTANKERKDYDPKREVNMAEARRKTTLEERKEIAEYCIEHNNDYKGTATLYNVSYNQVHAWVKKYRESGEDGLQDRRGHHKSDDEVDELERLRRENLRLKRQLEEQGMLVELLKKVKEFEGM